MKRRKPVAKSIRTTIKYPLRNDPRYSGECAPAPSIEEAVNDYFEENGIRAEYLRHDVYTEDGHEEIDIEWTENGDRHSLTVFASSRDTLTAIINKWAAKRACIIDEIYA